MNPNPKSPQAGQGALERRAPDMLRGWAAWQGAPATLTLHINGTHTATITANQSRPELAEAGLPPDCGFVHRPVPPLIATDIVELRLPDGTKLAHRNGMIDSCTQAQIAGWAIENGQGATLDILVNGTDAARLTASRPRPDLEKRGQPLISGFLHRFTPTLAPGDEITVRFTDGAPLKGSPKRLEAVRQGSLDRCTTTRIGGWASAGALPVPVEVLVNGIPTARVVCDRERPDLVAKGIAPKSGFLVSLPAPLALSDLVSVRFTDGTELRNSPRHPGHQQDGALDFCSTARVTGWAVQDGQPAELTLLLDGAPAASFLCDVPRPDLAQRGMPVNSGFAVLLPIPAGPDQEVAVCFADGTPLRGSPKRPGADYAAAAPKPPPRIGDSAPLLDPATIARANKLDLFAGLAVKEALLAKAPIAAAFAEFQTLVKLPASTSLARKKLVPLGRAAKKSRAAWHEIDPGGAAFSLPAPVVIGDGNHWPLTGHARPSFLACLRDVRLRGRSAILELADAALLDFHGDELNRLDDRLNFDPAVFAAVPGALHLLQPDPLAPEFSLPEAFSLLGVHTDAFGHWMWEYLPKYLAASACMGTGRGMGTGALPPVPVLVDAVRPGGEMPAAHLDLLRCLLPAGAEIIEIPPFTTVRVEKLWLAPAQMHMPLLERINEKFQWDHLASPPARLAALMRDMAARLPPLAFPGGAPKRVYLARRDSAHRRLTNRVVIEAIAQARGFTILHPETLDILAQANLLRGASHVLGPEGSAFFLGFFAQPGTKLGILDHPHTAGLALLTGPLAEMGVHSTVFTGPFAAVQEEWRHCSDYSLDEIAFAQWLDRWLATP